jgi:hypothetical protein
MYRSSFIGHLTKSDSFDPRFLELGQQQLTPIPASPKNIKFKDRQSTDIQTAIASASNCSTYCIDNQIDTNASAWHTHYTLNKFLNPSLRSKHIASVYGGSDRL